MMKNTLHIGKAALLILALSVAGCVAKPSPPTSFYMLGSLAPVPKNMQANTEDRNAVVAVETAKIAAYLDRNQIITDLDGTEFRLADFDHWAEPLSENLTRVIAENLSRLLSGEPADVFLSARSIPFDYSVDVEVMRLDGKMNDHVTLAARWAIFGPDENDLIYLKKSEYREAVGGDSFKELVLAHSRAVERLCQDMAEVLKKILKGPAK